MADFPTAGTRELGFIVFVIPDLIRDPVKIRRASSFPSFPWTPTGMQEVRDHEWAKVEQCRERLPWMAGVQVLQEQKPARCRGLGRGGNYSFSRHSGLDPESILPYFVIPGATARGELREQRTGMQGRIAPR